MRTALLCLLVTGCFAAGAGEPASSPEARLAAEGLELPSPAAPIANYVTWRRSGNVLYLSGHGECGEWTRGVVGKDLSVEQGYAVARDTAPCMLATIKAAVGDLGKVKQVLRIDGMVNAAPDFTDHPRVINGFSDVFVVAFGDAGKGARAAVGMSSLPGGIPVEISAIVELRD